jgi:hypothetical protein
VNVELMGQPGASLTLEECFDTDRFDRLSDLRAGRRVGRGRGFASVVVSAIRNRKVRQMRCMHDNKTHPGLDEVPQL